MVDLRIAVDGAASEVLTRAWSALTIRLAVGHEQDSASLTLAAAGGIKLPRKSASLRFTAGSADLGDFAADEVSGGSKGGLVTIDCAALDPVAAIRRPRDREWTEQTLGSVARRIAGDAGLQPAIAGTIAGVAVSAQPQIATSDMAFLRQLVAANGGRLLVQEGRLIITTGDAAPAAVPALQVDLLADGAWVEWRRGWSETQQRVEAAYLQDDGATIEVVSAGSGATVRRLPAIHPSRDQALAAARAELAAADTSRDYLEISTSLLPAAQVLQPLDLAGAAERLPVGFPAVVVHSVQHTIGRGASNTRITARPSAG